jgi:RNA polymerase sigma factor (sigma-70 family)
MDESRQRIVAWVGTHILPHEGAVRAWLRRSLVSPDDIDDLIQEAYCRIAGLDRVDHIERPQGYFFHVVRMLLAEQLRRSRIVRIETVAEMDILPFESDESSPERIAGARRELARVQRLIQGLPDRCRRIFELRKIEGVPQREIARMLGVTESTVENDVVKGMRLILKAMQEEGGPTQGRAEANHDQARNRRRD